MKTAAQILFVALISLTSGQGAASLTGVIKAQCGAVLPSVSAALHIETGASRDTTSTDTFEEDNYEIPE